MRPTLTAFFLAMLTLVPQPAHAAADPVLVDTCGQVVPPKAAAYLAADLDCSGYAGVTAVTLGKKATFDLAGFTLTTGPQYGIRCDDGRCTIRNGTVTGAAENGGIVVTKSRVENVTVGMSGMIAVSLNENSTLSGSTISGTARVGVHSSGSKKKLLIVDSTVTGHANLGVWATRVELRNSVVTGNLNNPDCTTGLICADLFTSRRPKLKASTCGRSQTLPENPTPGCLGWCLCTDD